MVSVLACLSIFATFGLTTPLVFLGAAGRLRSWWLGLCALAYAALLVLGFWWAGASSAVESGAGVGLLWLIMSVATAHAFVIRSRVVAGPGGHVDPAVAWAQARVARRSEVRQLIAEQPEVARELGVGRPDRQRWYDDGGLVDVNHVSAEWLVRALELSDEVVARIVALRIELGGFHSVAELSLVLGVPPQLFDPCADRMVFLP